MTKREAAVTAFCAALAAAGADVLRDEVKPQRVPAGGLIIVREGDAEVVDTVLSPLIYHYRHGIDVECYVAANAQAARISALDALLESINAALSDRTLGGAVEFVEIGDAVQVNEDAPEGAVPIRQALVGASLYYHAASALD